MMIRQHTYLLEVTVTVDADEVDSPDKADAKVKQIRQAVESLDPSIGIVIVEGIQ